MTPRGGAAYARARAKLAKLVRSGTLRLPPAAAALDVAARGQLSAVMAEPASSLPPALTACCRPGPEADGIPGRDPDANGS